MTTFDKREEGFEKKFVHDEELKFKAEARRNKQVGLWAAERMGLSGAAADSYAKEIVVAEIDGGEAGVFKKLRSDFDARKVAVGDAEISRKMDELLAAAVAEIRKTG